MGTVMLSLSVSVVLLILVTSVAQTRAGLRGAVVSTVAILVVSFCLMAPPLLLQALFMLLAMAVLALFRLKPIWVLPGGVAAIAIAYGLVLPSSIHELREHSRLRDQYPFESVSDRLAYERTTDRETQSPIAVESHVDLSNNVEHRLGEFEEQRGNSNRSYALQALHSRTRDDFVLARGFGSARMRSMRLHDIELPDSQPVPLPSPPPLDYEPTRADRPLPLAADVPFDPMTPPQDKLLALHDAGLRDFLDDGRMGYVADRDHVAGFQSHGFMGVPALPTEGAARDWRIVRLELVSLLKHPAPVAYLSRHLPQMDQLDELPTRALDRFEQQAIDRLRSDEDVVIDEGVNRIRMVGSIRAAKDCLACHAAQRGELLGAFSYELVPSRRIPEPTESAVPLSRRMTRPWEFAISEQ